MRKEFTAVVERDEDWYIAYCPQVPGSNGQGLTLEACKQSLADSIALILYPNHEDGSRRVPVAAIHVRIEP